MISLQAVSSELSVTEWPMFHHDLRNTGYSPSNAPSTNNVLWTYTTGGKISSSPAVVDGTLFISSTDGKLYALNADNGAFLWSYTLGPAISPSECQSSPAVVDGVVYVGYVNGMFYAIDALTGGLIWSYDSEQTMINSSPAVAEGLVYFASYDGGNIYALDASTGALVWSRGTASSHVSSTPAVVDGILYIGVWWEDAIYALDASTGDVIWSYTTGYVVGGGPAVVDGVVYAYSQDRQLYALDASTGAFKWSYMGDPTSSPYSPAVAYGMVFFGSRYVGGGGLYALNKNGGAIVWKKTGDYVDSIAAAGDMVFVGSSTKFYALNAFSGAEVWNYPIEVNRGAHAAIAYGKVFAGSRDGKVYCFGARAPTKWAAVIGINEYSPPNPHGKGGPTNSARDFFDILVNYMSFPEDNVHLLTDDVGSNGDDVTREIIMAELTWLQNLASNDDIVVFYIAGHGAQAPDGVESIVPHDGRYITDFEFAGEINKIKSQKMTIILDISFSGGFVTDGQTQGQGVRGFVESWTDLAEGTPNGRIILTACAENVGPWLPPVLGSRPLRDAKENLFWSPETGFRYEMVFSHHLVKGFKGEADSNKDSKVTVEEAFDFARGLARFDLQTPLMYDGYPGFSESGDQYLG